MKYLLDLAPEELSSWVKNFGEKQYHAGQILKAIYRRRISDFSEITELSKNLREKLPNYFFIYKLIPQELKTSIDGTIRIKYRADNDNFYTVFLPSLKHNSVCVSTQIGCRGSCIFCASGGTKFVRNLTTGEIIEQVFHTEKIVGKKVNRVLFMGMGEPLDNWENVSRAIARLVSPESTDIGAKNITISTVGISDKIFQLLQLEYRIPLAFSFHSAVPELRTKLIPHFSPDTDEKLEQLLLGIARYSRKTKTELTIEYILISGVTDTRDQRIKLIAALEKFRRFGVKLKVNLIPCNPLSARQTKFRMPEMVEMEKFQNALKEKGFLTIIRKNRGVDVGAACGQLGLK